LSLIISRPKAKKSPLTEIDLMTGIFEHPYKNFDNSYWIIGINQTAAKMGIGVMLNGQLGNATVSWGQFHPYMKYLVKRGRLQTFFKEFKAYSVRNKTRPAPLFLKTVYCCFVPRRIKEYRYRKRGGMDSAKMLSPMRPAGIEHKIRKFKCLIPEERLNNRFSRKKYRWKNKKSLLGNHA
jgi:hypothetical protein